MKIYQICIGYIEKTSIANCIDTIMRALDNIGVENYVYALNLQMNKEKDRIFSCNDVSKIDINSDDIIFYHFHDASFWNIEIEKMRCRKVLIFNNITPPHFFDYNCEFQKRMLQGIYHAKRTSKYYNLAITPSEFNKQDLVSFGWAKDDVFCIPTILYNNNAKFIIKNKRVDGMKRFLFVGRFVENKKIEDVIDIFDYYQKCHYSNSELYLVGSSSNPEYFAALQEFIEKKQVKNVVIKKAVSQDELEAIYSDTDLLLFMSEHEGFGMPVLEAMQRRIPVIAYRSSAVEEVVSDYGVLVDTKDPIAVCKSIDMVLTNDEIKNSIIERQLKLIEKYNNNSLKGALEKLINQVCKNEVNYRDEQNEKIHIKPNNKNVDIDWTPLKDEKDIVIYGVGKVGKVLVSSLKDRKQIETIILCDNSLVGSQVENVSVIDHDEMIHRYNGEIVIVSIQKDYISVVCDLLNAGIPKEKIYWFNNSNKRIIH